MDIKEDMRINSHQPTVGCADTELGRCFKLYIEKYGVNNIYFICSAAYTLGVINGKREERARRQASHSRGVNPIAQ